MIGEEPQYSRLAARLLAGYIDKEVRNQGVMSFSQSIALGHAEGLIGEETRTFVKDNARKLELRHRPGRDRRFEYFGLRTVYDRYLLRHPPAGWWSRPRSTSSCGSPAAWRGRAAEAIEFYRLMSSLAYLPSSPTLFNSGTRHTQMSSCYLVDSPRDDLDSIYARYQQSRPALEVRRRHRHRLHRVRSRGSLIRGTNGALQRHRAVPADPRLVGGRGQPGRPAQGCRVRLPRAMARRTSRSSSTCKDNTGDDARRTHNLNLANWIPDQFMRRVEADAEWSLFDPDQAPELPDLWGEAFDAAYRRAEEDGRYVRQVKARELYARR